jgi:hypothetical protein
MKFTKANDDPAIVDVYFDELESFDLSSVFSHKEAYRLNYGDLVVYEGRKTIPNDSEAYGKMREIVYPSIMEITKTLLSMDPVRYPKPQVPSLLKNCRVGILVTIDEAGFSQPWHLDNRFIVASGMINATDNITSTHFSRENFHWENGGMDFSDCEIIHRAQNKKLTGTAWLNTESTWHCVPKVIEKERSILLYNVFYY